MRISILNMGLKGILQSGIVKSSSFRVIGSVGENLYKCFHCVEGP